MPGKSKPPPAGHVTLRSVFEGLKAAGAGTPSFETFKKYHAAKAFPEPGHPQGRLIVTRKDAAAIRKEETATQKRIDGLVPLAETAKAAGFNERSLHGGHPDLDIIEIRSRKYVTPGQHDAFVAKHRGRMPISELAEKFGRPRKTIQNWIDDGRIPGFRVGKTRYVSRALYGNEGHTWPRPVRPSGRTGQQKPTKTTPAGKKPTKPTPEKKTIKPTPKKPARPRREARKPATPRAERRGRTPGPRPRAEKPAPARGEPPRTGPATPPRWEKPPEATVEEEARIRRDLMDVAKADQGVSDLKSLRPETRKKFFEGHRAELRALRHSSSDPKRTRELDTRLSVLGRIIGELDEEIEERKRLLGG